MSGTLRAVLEKLDLLVLVPHRLARELSTVLNRLVHLFLDGCIYDLVVHFRTMFMILLARLSTGAGLIFMPNAPVGISNGINKNTFMLMDGYNSESILFPDSIKGEIGYEKVLNVDKNVRIARHNNKANIVYLDGQVKSINSSELLRIGNNYEQNTQFWSP